jgi:hypothetical protein
VCRLVSPFLANVEIVAMFKRILDWVVSHLADKAWPAVWAAAVAIGLGFVTVWYGYIWWHPSIVLALMVVAFFLALFMAYAWFASERRRRRDARAFDPRTLITQLRQLHLCTLRRNDPFLSFAFAIQNASGHNIIITGVEGHMRVGSDACSLSPVMELPAAPLSLDSTSHLVLLCQIRN